MFNLCCKNIASRMGFIWRLLSTMFPKDSLENQTRICRWIEIRHTPNYDGHSWWCFGYEAPKTLNREVTFE